MKKHLFLLLALCAAVFVACSDDDGNGKITPILSPNNTDIYMEAVANEPVYVLVENAKDLNVVQINDKTTDDKGKTKETNVRRYDEGKLANQKYVTEGQWFTVKIEEDGGVYRRIEFKAIPYNDYEKDRVKYVHVSCGDNMYGISFRLVQRHAVKSN